MINECCGGKAARAVDGNTSGRYNHNSCTHTHKRQGAWWKVDMQQKYSIGQVIVYNRADCCQNRLNKFSVYADAHKCGTVAVAKNSNTIDCFGQQAQSVKVALSGNNYLTLCEVEVYEVRIPATPHWLRSCLQRGCNGVMHSACSYHDRRRRASLEGKITLQTNNNLFIHPNPSHSCVVKMSGQDIPVHIDIINARYAQIMARDKTIPGNRQLQLRCGESSVMKNPSGNGQQEMKFTLATNVDQEPSSDNVGYTLVNPTFTSELIIQKPLAGISSRISYKFRLNTIINPADKIMLALPNFILDKAPVPVILGCGDSTFSVVGTNSAQPGATLTITVLQQPMIKNTLCEIIFHSGIVAANEIQPANFVNRTVAAILRENNDALPQPITTSPALVQNLAINSLMYAQTTNKLTELWYEFRLSDELNIDQNTAAVHIKLVLPHFQFTSDRPAVFASGPCEYKQITAETHNSGSDSATILFRILETLTHVKTNTPQSNCILKVNEGVRTPDSPQPENDPSRTVTITKAGAADILSAMPIEISPEIPLLVKFSQIYFYSKLARQETGLHLKFETNDRLAIDDAVEYIIPMAFFPPHSMEPHAIGIHHKSSGECGDAKFKVTSMDSGTVKARLLLTIVSGQTTALATCEISIEEHQGIYTGNAAMKNDVSRKIRIKVAQPVSGHRNVGPVPVMLSSSTAIDLNSDRVRNSVVVLDSGPYIYP